MLSDNDLRNVVADLSYKPGWMFRLKLDWSPVATLEITAKVLHSTTLEQVTFAMQRFVPQCARVHEAAFLGWWKTVLMEAEFHELREFARYRGELIANPHSVVAT